MAFGIVAKIQTGIIISGLTLGAWMWYQNGQLSENLQEQIQTNATLDQKLESERFQRNQLTEEFERAEQRIQATQRRFELSERTVAELNERLSEITQRESDLRNSLVEARRANEQNRVWLDEKIPNDIVNILNGTDSDRMRTTTETDSGGGSTP